MSVFDKMELEKHEDKPLPPGVCATCDGMGEWEEDVIIYSAGGPDHDTETRQCAVCCGTGRIDDKS